MRWVLLLLAGCGAAGALPGIPGPLPRYTHSVQLLADFGEPCSRDGPEGGLQAWRYCAGACQPGQDGAVCVVECFPGCASWRFDIAGGIVVNTVGP